MHTLVIGSTAFDKIMMFPGKFGDHILPDKTHSINVAFHIPSIITEHGGTGANISYALAALGDIPVLISAVGDIDCTEYLRKLDNSGVDISMVATIENMYCAQANIMTDLVNNQITAFHPGAMSQSVHIDLDKVVSKYSDQYGYDFSDICIVAPNDKDAMIKDCHSLTVQKKRFIFDPGQALPLFSKTELLTIINNAYAITVNDYESSLLMQTTGLTIEDITKLLSRNGDGGLVVTRGHKGTLQ